MNSIHATAVVHPQARLGNQVTIGAYAVVDEHVELGDGCEVRAHAVVTGHTKVGAGTQIGYGAVVGSEPQDVSYKGAVSFVEIGERNVLREYVTIHRGTQEGSVTKLGDDNFLMTGAHVGHNCQLGNRIILVNNVLLGGYVHVADRAFMGGDVVVHQHVRIGEYVMVRGQTRIAMDIPPFCMAVMENAVCGLNRVGLKRNGFSTERRRAILQAYDVFYHSGLNRQQALEQLKQMDSEDVQLMVRFIQNTKRGVCRAVRASATKGRGEALAEAFD